MELLYALLGLIFSAGFMLTVRDSVFYAKLVTNKQIGQVWEAGGRVVGIPFEHTVVAGETGGASAGASDFVNLCTLDPYDTVIGLQITADNLWASVGANGTLRIGDAADDDRFMLPMEFYTAGGGPIPAEVAGLPTNMLPMTGQNYRISTSTIVRAGYRTANPTVGKQFKGVIFVLRPLGP